eukprot:703827_1
MSHYTLTVEIDGIITILSRITSIHEPHAQRNGTESPQWSVLECIGVYGFITTLRAYAQRNGHAPFVCAIVWMPFCLIYIPILNNTTMKHKHMDLRSASPFRIGFDNCQTLPCLFCSFS